MRFALFYKQAKNLRRRETELQTAINYHARRNDLTGRLRLENRPLSSLKLLDQALVKPDPKRLAHAIRLANHSGWLPLPSPHGRDEGWRRVGDPPYNIPIAGMVSGNGKVKHQDFVMGVGEWSEDEFLDFLTRYGLELDPKYVDVIVRRWEQYTGEEGLIWRTRCFGEPAMARLTSQLNALTGEDTVVVAGSRSVTIRRIVWSLAAVTAATVVCAGRRGFDPRRWEKCKFACLNVIGTERYTVVAIIDRNQNLSGC